MKKSLKVIRPLRGRVSASNQPDPRSEIAGYLCEATPNLALRSRSYFSPSWLSTQA